MPEIFTDEQVVPSSPFFTPEDQRGTLVRTRTDYNYDAQRMNIVDAFYGGEPKPEVNEQLAREGRLEEKRVEATLREKIMKAGTLDALGQEAFAELDEEAAKNVLSGITHNVGKPLAFEDAVSQSLENAKSLDPVETELALENPELFDEYIEQMNRMQILEQRVMRPLAEEVSEESWGAFLKDMAGFFLPFYEVLGGGDINPTQSKDSAHARMMNAADPEAEADLIANELRESGIVGNNKLLAATRAREVTEGIGDLEQAFKYGVAGLDLFGVGSLSASVVKGIKPIAVMTAIGARTGASRAAAGEVLQTATSVSEVAVQAVGGILPTNIQPSRSLLQIVGTKASVKPLIGIGNKAQGVLNDMANVITDTLSSTALPSRLNDLQITKAQAVTESAVRSDLFRRSTTLRPAFEFADTSVSVEPITNLRRMTFSFGKPSDPTSGFVSHNAAKMSASKFYRLKKGEYTIEQTNGGFFLQMSRDVKETGSGIGKLGARDGFNHRFPGGERIFGPDAYMDAASREAAHLSVDSYQRYNKAFTTLGSEIAKRTGGVLNRKTRQSVRKLIEEGHQEGKWWDIYDMKRILGRDPTDKEQSAYLGYRMINDLEYTFRNAEARIQKVRAGYENVTFSLGSRGGASLDAKIFDSIPKGIDQFTVYDSLTDTIMKGPSEALIQKALSEGAVLVQPMHVDELIDAIGNPAHFVLTKNPKRQPVAYNTIGYREGGHRPYEGSFFVKQGREVAGQLVRPRTFYVMKSLKEAEEHVAGLNVAREAALAQRAGTITRQQATKIVSENSQYQTVDEFLDAATNKEFDLTRPFEVVKDGQQPKSYSDRVVRSEMDDPGISSIVDVYKEKARAYTGRRGERLLDPSETAAPVLDPVKATGKAISNVMHLAAFTNYRIKQVDDWYATFSHLIDVPNHGRGSAVHPAIAFRHGVFDKARATPAEIRIGEAYRRSVNDVIGTQTESGRWMSGVLDELADAVDKSGRPQTAALIRKSEGVNIPSEMKKLAFDAKLGTFEPSQLLLQPQAMTVAISLHPVDGARAMTAVAPLRWALNASDETLEFLSRQKLVHGFDPDDFKELVGLLRTSGKTIMGGSSGYINELDNFALSIWSHPISKSREAGRQFFFEAERWNKIFGSALAYRRMRAAKPGVSMQKQVGAWSVQADQFAVNMTSASAAQWQRGLLSVPTQFLSYQARILDMLFGPNLTMAQKAQLVVGQYAFYGVAGVPFVNFLVDQGAELVGTKETGESPLDEVWGGVFDDVLWPLVFDEDVASRERFGPFGGRIFLDAIYDESLVSLFMGPSGNIIYDTATDIGRALTLMRASNDPLNAAPELFANVITENISSFGRLSKAWLAAHYGKVYNTDQSRLLTDDVSSGIVVAQLFGLPLEQTTKAYDNFSFFKARDAALRDVAKMVSADEIKKLRALEKGDMKAARVYANRSASILLGFDLLERQKIWRSVKQTISKSLDDANELNLFRRGKK